MTNHILINNHPQIMLQVGLLIFLTSPSISQWALTGNSQFSKSQGKLRSNVQYPSHHSTSYPTTHNTTTMAGKGSSKWSRSVNGDAQQPSASKKNVPPGRTQSTMMPLPPTPLRELPSIPPLTTTRSMERAPSTTLLPPMPPGATPPIPPSTTTLAEVPLPPMGPQTLFATPQTPPQLLTATTRKQATLPSTWPLHPLQPSPPPTH